LLKSADTRYYWELTVGNNFWALFALVFLISLSISMASMVLLEMIEQMETGKKTSLTKACLHAFTLGLPRVLPITFIWSILWFFILILQSKKRNSVEPSPEDAARTLAGANSPFSAWDLGLDMVSKLLRMTVFMALPSVAWGNKGPFEALGNSFRIIKKHHIEFLSTYGLTEAATSIMFLPLIPLFVAAKVKAEIPPEIWYLAIFYMGIVWSFGIYLEQMMVGILHLWHLKWEALGANGNIGDVSKPNLFDKIYELSEDSIIKNKTLRKRAAERHQRKLDYRANSQPLRSTPKISRLKTILEDENPKYQYVIPRREKKANKQEALSAKEQMALYTISEAIRQHKIGESSIGCPECTAPMAIIKIEDLEIDLCVKCRGVWMEQGELSELIGENIDTLKSR
jgi:hypothetical protein